MEEESDGIRGALQLQPYLPLVECVLLAEHNSEVGGRGSARLIQSHTIRQNSYGDHKKASFFRMFRRGRCLDWAHCPPRVMAFASRGFGKLVCEDECPLSTHCLSYRRVCCICPNSNDEILTSKDIRR
jgi:hypothetical protein